MILINSADRPHPAGQNYFAAIERCRAASVVDEETAPVALVLSIPPGWKVLLYADVETAEADNAAGVWDDALAEFLLENDGTVITV